MCGCPNNTENISARSTSTNSGIKTLKSEVGTGMVPTKDIPSDIFYENAKMIITKTGSIIKKKV